MQLCWFCHEVAHFLFSNNVPCLQGMDVIFRVGIAILQSSQTELLSKDMELMLQFFQKEIAIKFEADEESFFTVAYQVRFNTKKLKR